MSDHLPHRLVAAAGRGLRTIQASFRLAAGASPGQLAALLALAALVPLASPALAYTGKLVIDSVMAHAPAAAAGYVAAELGLILLQLGAGRGLLAVRSMLGARVAIETSAQLVKQAQRLECATFESAAYQDQLARAEREPATRAVGLLAEGLTVLQGAIALGLYAAILLRFSPWIGLLLLVAAVPVALVELKSTSDGVAAQDARVAETRQHRYLADLLLKPEHAKEVRLLGLAPLLQRRMQALGLRFYQGDRALILRSLWLALGTTALAPITFYGCYAVLALAAARGDLTVGELTLLAISFHQAQMTIRLMIAAARAAHECALQLDGFLAFMQLPVRRPTAEATLRPARTEPTEEGIRCEDLGFRYPAAPDWALRHVNLSLRPGELLAIVGSNGSGKTTLIKLLTGLYRPSEGRVLVDGIDVRAWDPALLAARFGVLFQDFARLQMTLRENIEAGRSGAGMDEAALTAALDQAGAQRLLAQLPGGFATQLGRCFADGFELSGGQWQTVALARVLARAAAGAGLLVFDEPTAALDQGAQQLVFERLRQLSSDGKKSVILISHHPESALLADKVVTLRAGRVVDSGTAPVAPADELIRHAGAASDKKAGIALAAKTARSPGADSRKGCSKAGAEVEKGGDFAGIEVQASWHGA